MASEFFDCFYDIVILCIIIGSGRDKSGLILPTADINIRAGLGLPVLFPFFSFVCVHISIIIIGMRIKSVDGFGCITRPVLINFYYVKMG